ncbi:C39 family peptidase [Streptococcus agalactiae]|uniref:C39 family peptidase n=1 Tax=Streptococcus agalactiae TaxID=1311 RepID=UPI00085C6BD7|nr:C39 family peptidase [Streptococcus agalactiae]
MNQSKIITGLVVATLSTGAGIVLAEDVTLPNTDSTATSGTEIVTAPQVTQEQVDSSKAVADQATNNVSTQQNVVNGAQKLVDQAQANVVNATTAVTNATATVEQATSEAVTQAQNEVTEATTAVKNAETNLITAQSDVTKAQEAVVNQTQVVADNQASVDQAQTEVTKAQEGVNTAKQSIDTTQANANLAEAEKVVDEKTTNVSTAETSLSEAKQADQKLIQDIASAEVVLQNQNSTLTQKQEALNNVLDAIKAHQVNISPDSVGYFNQNDPRWGWLQYGRWSMGVAGCAPTSMAMVFSELLGHTVLPTDVANYLYNNTDYFNKSVIGTKGLGIISASNGFGLNATSLANQNELIKALQDGYFVTGAVGNNKFTPYGGTHELVLKGYSNGNTFAYDPYTRSNIGWYPVSRLWAEQSQDPDDRYGLLSPFVKITTQKMAELETQKVQLTSAVNTAKSQLDQAKQVLSNLQATPLQTLDAQSKLDQAKVELALAQDNYVKAQEAVKLASQELAVKEAKLKTAQSDLLAKQDELTTVKTILADSQLVLASLQAKLTEAQTSVAEAKTSLDTVKTNLTQKQANLLSLQNAPKVLSEAQDKLVIAKSDLAKKKAILDKEVAKLKELQAVQSEVQNQYSIVLEAFKAVQEAKRQAELTEIYEDIITEGGEVIPVVDETGKITGYVDGSKKTISNEMNFNLTSIDKTPVKLSANQENNFIKPSTSVLPQAGEELSILTVLGASIVSIFALAILKRKRN